VIKIALNNRRGAPFATQGPAKNRDSVPMFRLLDQSGRVEGGSSGGGAGGMSLCPGEGTMSGPGCGRPDGTSGGGISGGPGGRTTSGSGIGIGLFGSGVGMLPSLLVEMRRTCICSGSATSVSATGFITRPFLLSFVGLMTRVAPVFSKQLLPENGS
jgi:hypothetical protein